MHCQWCESEKTIKTFDSAYWELPDGTKAVEITEVPSINCKACGMIYVEEFIIEEIEDQFMLIETKKLPKAFSYEFFMNQPRILKKNYFKF
ncbi:YokU family protein [Evansella sp. AB-P1]|uniref:YokU family protein n=1 Tax=Evansella sp. AB-P1 TaxID=3037653 RepID=UPI00241DC97A|nr:YokU family protein [Evansella sp. AB-P1]MDG5787513.1 YokU family protein [Evansella sp. AB-P1]